MNDYNELIERCKEILEWKKTGLLNGDALREYANRQPYGSEYNKLAIAEAVTLKDAAEAFVVLTARVAELESRLEISPLHNVDGIMARDATIKLQDERIAELEAERAEREKQEPVAWYCDGEDGREYNGSPQMSNVDAAPVRPNDSELEMIARAHGTGGWQTLGDMVTFARAIESAVLRANGFKLEGEQ